MNNHEKRFYFLTGASGARKTTLVSQLEKIFLKKTIGCFYTLTLLVSRLKKK